MAYVPNLRFNDHDTWIENSLQNVTSYFKSGKNINAKMILEEGLYPVYGGNGIRGFTNTYNQDGKYILVGRQGALCGNVRLVEGKSYVTEHGIIIINNNQSTIEYLKPLLEHMHLEKESDQSAQPGLAVNKLLLLKQYFPSIENQERIGKLFTLLEMKIQLQNKIIEDLIALRKSIIERTFSLVNSSWNKFTFNDIFIERKEMHIKDSSVIHATLSKEGIFPKTDRYNRDFLVKDEDKKYKVSYLNDICYNPANLKFGVITRNNYGKCIISPIYVTYEVKPHFNPKFIELFVTRSAFLKEIRKYEQGTVYERMAVSSDDFLTYTTRLPDVDFQNEIVSKIDLFDKKITQEKIYLELLKNQKNYLLSNLFI